MTWLKPQIRQQIILRTPQFPIEARLTESWEELKSSIALSSDDFYQQIKHINADDLGQLPSKVFLTILRYFNRAKFRAVPYGTFASVSLIDPIKEDHRKYITVNQVQIMHRYRDWSGKDDYPYDFEELELKDGYLFANSSYYRIQESIRYIYRDGGSFELAEVRQEKLLLQILDYCRQPVTVCQVYRHFEDAESGREVLRNYLQELIWQQLLFTSLDPNIIGEDYFQRRQVGPDQAQSDYVICEREYTGGSLEGQLLGAIPRYIRLMQQLAPAPKPVQALQHFIQAFIRRFDQREIPIMHALDPELGIGYAQLDQSAAQDGLVPELAARKLNTVASPDNLRRFLAQGLPAGETTGPRIIFLDNCKPDMGGPIGILPNSLTSVITVSDGLVHLEHLGGCSANQLAGRFSMAGDAIYHFSKQVAVEEQAANPDALFFDVAYMGEGRVDNVNRRRPIYNLQLSILSYDTSADPLVLDDIMVSVIGDELVLRSKQRNKRLIPRIASAYNYQRSDLPLFRLLCDLQYQGLQTDLSFNIRELLPDLTCYPRIQFENMVVSPAMWLLERKDVISKEPGRLQAVRDYLERLHVSRYIKVGAGDQKLCLDVSKEEDMMLLLQAWDKNSQLWIEEAYIPENSVIRDQNGDSYYAQLMLTICHGRELYKGITTPLTRTGIQTFFAPGNKQWLYYEIYCHPERADQLLQEKVQALLESFRSAIKKWFFIRYNDQGNHIRLRIQLQDPRARQPLEELLNVLLHPELEEGIISDLQVKTYRRELERYGPAQIEQVEEHFFSDSRYVLNLIGASLDDFSKYQLCLDLAQHIRAAGVIEDKDFQQLLKAAYGSLSKEHKATPKVIKPINKMYDNYIQASKQGLTPVLEQRLQTFRDSFVTTLERCVYDRRCQLFIDLFHMHINRLFPEHQRTHELIVYDFLTKQWKRETFMIKQQLQGN